MALKTELNVLLNKKMDRKDFLRHAAIGVVAVTGLSAILRTVVPSPAQKQKTVGAAAPQGYGSSVYGGTKTS